MVFTLLSNCFFSRGIEWTGLKSFLSYSYPNAAKHSTVRNELQLTDFFTGESTPLRTDKGEESPIEIVRVSPLKQFFILITSGGPLELWDLESKQLVRTLTKKFPLVTALVSFFGYTENFIDYSITSVCFDIREIH